MKSYIVKIELEESDPLIWRRVIMPAGATYRRLHDVIQNVTNFQSGYPSEGYHLYNSTSRKIKRLSRTMKKLILSISTIRKTRPRMKKG
ncbi:hypothetical protein [Bacillus sp. es.034]|uniref:IS1096 element passenger TnpR family protein n=1 Tax=Bacillus sp. es.034 TaxID=1761763 RepID=UPI0025701BDD|nr:hypothetical protein [Bacillus sp. es.034]